MLLSVHVLICVHGPFRSGAGEFEEDGEGDCPDEDESEVFGGEAEEGVECGGGFFFHGDCSL